MMTMTMTITRLNVNWYTDLGKVLLNWLLCLTPSSNKSRIVVMPMTAVFGQLNLVVGRMLRSSLSKRMMLMLMMLVMMLMLMLMMVEVMLLRLMLVMMRLMTLMLMLMMMMMLVVMVGS